MKYTPNYGSLLTGKCPHIGGYPNNIICKPRTGHTVYIPIMYIKEYKFTSGGYPPADKPSKRWLVHYKKDSKNITLPYYDADDSCTIIVWDNHGQQYSVDRNRQSDPNHWSYVIAICEDDKKYPEPLPDYMIDLIKSGDYVECQKYIMKDYLEILKRVLEQEATMKMLEEKNRKLEEKLKDLESKSEEVNDPVAIVDKNFSESDLLGLFS